MKRMVLVWFMSICFIGAVSAQTITVKSDRSLDTDFNEYKTFYWASQVDSWRRGRWRK